MSCWSWMLTLVAVSSCSAAPVTSPPLVTEPSSTPTRTAPPEESPAAPLPPVSAAPPVLAAPLAPTAPEEAPVVESLEPRTIQRTIQQNFGTFRPCYEQSLGTSPNLMNRVTVRFAIGKDGAVTSAVMKDTTMWKKEAISCVVDAVKKLRFPRSARGVPSVTYPIMFTPGG